jgi:hypothetical protein
VIRRRLIAALGALALGSTVSTPARAQADERLGKQLEAQQGDLDEHEARIKELARKVTELAARQKETEAELAETRKKLAAAPSPAPAPALPGVASVLPDFLRGLSLGGYVQGQYESHQDSEDQLRQGGDPLNQNRFLVRRARLKIEKEWQYASAMIELDGNTVRGAAFGLQHAEASLLYRAERPFSAPPVLKATFGQMDTPFGHELVESPRERWFLERSLISRSMFPAEPDLGFRLQSALGWFRASVGIFNGEPAGERTGFALRAPLAAKSIVGRVGADVELLQRLHLTGSVSVINGKGFHPGTDLTKSQIQWKDTNEDGVIEPTELQAVPATTGQPSQSFTRWAVGGDLRASLKTALGTTQLDVEVVLASNMDRGLFIADPTLTGIDSREVGYVIGATQEIFGYGVIGFRYDSYDPNGDARDKQGGKLVPASQTVRTWSPLIGVAIPDRARLLFQYDVVRDNLGRDPRGVPTDLRNDAWTLRLQVSL